MSYTQYPPYASASSPNAQTQSTSEWGVNRMTDHIPERTLVSEIPDRSSHYQHQSLSRPWSNHSISTQRQPTNQEYFGYTPTNNMHTYNHTPQQLVSMDYRASPASARVYEPRPSATEPGESQSRILEVQTTKRHSFSRPLPLTLNPLKDDNQNLSELSTQASLEESIMLQLQNATITNSTERRPSTIEIETVSSFKRMESPPIPQPRMTEYYTNSPGASSPSSNTFSPARPSSGFSQGEEAPSPTPSVGTSSNASPGLGTKVLTPQQTPDSGRQNPSHFIMIPIGRTGHGKSSLLNSIIGYNEFRASNSVQPVTDAVTERSAIWKVDRKRNLVTVADTPGFADPNRQDPRWKVLIKEYIISIGKRFGIDAFMLTFQLGASADVFFKIVEEFVGMMDDMQPKTWWDNVVFVFTRFDHSIAHLQQTTAQKMLIVGTLIPKVKETYNLERTPPVIFLGTQQPVCGYARGAECDCIEATRHLLDGQRRLLRAVTSRSISGRWCYEAPESDEEEEDDETLDSSSQEFGLQRSRVGSVARKLERKQTNRQHTNSVMRNLRNTPSA